MDPFILLGLIVAVGVGGLTMRDLVRRGRLLRERERRGLQDPAPPALPAERVQCPECAEAILPAARRCPYCRTPITGRAE